MAIFVEVLDARSVEGGGTADDAVNLVAFRDEQLSEVCAILTGDAGDESDLQHDTVRTASGVADARAHLALRRRARGHRHGEQSKQMDERMPAAIHLTALYTRGDHDRRG